MRRALALLSMALAGCVSPAPRSPPLVLPTRYTAQPLPEQTATAADFHGGHSQHFAAAKELPAQWWALFQSPALDRLVRQALDNSPSLAKTRARLRQAQEEFNARSGATRYPSLDATLSANRVNINGATPELPLQTPLNLYLASVGVTYSLDLFGANRHELQALRAEVDFQRYELEAARLMLVGNVITAAIREAALREQIMDTTQIIALKLRQQAVKRRLLEIGAIAENDVVALELDLSETRAQLPTMQAELERLRHRLAILLGQSPASLQAPEFRLADLQLPTELPLTLPSELARQRPDIRAAQALLDQAGAKLGVATARLYPQFSLSANLGQIGSSGQLFAGGAGFYLLGAQLTQPIFHGGELQARRRAALAALEQADAAYREVVLQGLQNVADVLRALQADAEELQQRSAAAQQARRHLDIATARFQAGGISHYDLLGAQQKLHQALLARTQTLANRYADTAALFQALGGGWQARDVSATP
jgi:NodT family efflux transporter outer membrane factor (OMF) lipoprotein